MGWLRRHGQRDEARLQRNWNKRLKAVLAANPPLPAPHEEIANRLAELVIAEDDDAAWFRLTEEQRGRYLDTSHIDRLVSSGEESEDYLCQVVEIRAIGHRLNATGGMPLMVSVAERANALGETRLMRKIEMYWDGIGSFQK